MSETALPNKVRALIEQLTHELKKTQAQLKALSAAQTEPIAIIGMGCRFPGGAADPESYWQVLEQGRDCVVRIPSKRWPDEALPADSPGLRWAGLLDAVDTFDASFFGISPREAASLDPQQRLLLEVSWEALESAGVVPGSLMGSSTGVFMGLCATDYRQRIEKKGAAELDAFDTTGNLASTAAGRISYTLGLQGPCLAIDTACSSSLVAVHAACASLRSREADLALAGGVNIILDPIGMLLLSRTQALSPDGRCKTFDAGANGFVRGEGCGVIVLKRLADAQASRDPIAAVILGSVVNQDGRSAGLTAPNLLAQQAMLRKALDCAGVAAADLGLIETHGTGTALGDPIEFEALKAVVGAPRADGSSCYLGAVKTNLGHLEAAAGIAGLIKAVLCLKQQAIPRNLHLRTLNPHIDLGGTPFVLPAQQIPWPKGPKPRRAGVSSFGLSGTNAHVLLGEAPAEASVPETESRSGYLLPLSARTPSALRDGVLQQLRFLQQHPEHSLKEIGYTASVGRTSFEHRLVARGAEPEGVRAALQAFLKGEPHPGLAQGRVPEKSTRKVVFIFPGQGGQWRGMGRELLGTEPVFRQVVEECARHMRAFCAVPLLSVLEGEGDDALLERVDVVQPAVFALQVGLAALWQSFGVEPAAVVGHSMGEVAAAYVAGALTLSAACRLICQRSLVVRRHSGAGGMAIVEQPWEELRPLLRRTDGQVALAALNGPRSTVLSGKREALAEVLDRLSEQGVFWKWIKVDYASHSPQMDALRPELQRLLADLPSVPPQRLWFSTVTGQLQTAAVPAEYWHRNLREPVRLWPVLQALAEQGFDTVLELNPHPILQAAIEAGMEGRVQSLLVRGTMKRDLGGMEPQLESLSELYVHGVPVQWERLFPQSVRKLVLPTYPWQRERHWIETEPPPQAGRDSGGEAGALELLYRPAWRPGPLRGAPAAASAGTWVLVSSGGSTAAALARALAERGAACIQLRHELGAAREDAGQGAEPLGASTLLRGIVVLCGTEELGLLGSAQDRIGAQTAGGVLASLQALMRRTEGSRAPVWLVTRGAMSCGAQEPPGSAEQATLWGLGRVFSLEQPERWGGMVDLPLVDPASQLPLLVSHLLAGDGEDHAALRTEGRLLMRLHRFVPKPADRAWRTQGTALITGGLGGLGSLIARWLIERGAEHVVLTGRRGLAAPGAAQTVDSLRRLGVPVTVLAADVCDREAMAAVIDHIDTKLPVLRTVFHAAGVARELTIEAMDRSDLDSVMGPKIDGTRILEALTLQRELDAFVCFSSISAVWGGRGLAAYAAANAFEDAWAQEQRALGRPVVSIDWGRWDRGMVTSEQAEKLDQSGVEALQEQAALRALERVLLDGAAQVVIAKVDWSRFRSTYESRGRRPLLAELDGGGAGIPEGRESAGSPPQDTRPEVEGSALGPSEAREIVLRAVAQVLRMAQPEIPLHRPFRELGLDSLTAVELSRRLSAAIGRKLPSTVAFDHSTVDKLAGWLSTGPAAAPASLPAAADTSSRDPIAIIGMSCRLPGGINSPEDFWELLKRGGDAVTDIPKERWDIEPFYDPDPDRPGKTYSRCAGMLTAVDQFDAGFFSIPPREAVSLDPQQRLLLEVSWEALERAAQPPDRLAGSASGVFMAIGSSEYGAKLLHGPAAGSIDVYALTGSMTSMAAGRLSYLLGLRGPSLVVDTACSSSLVAVHLACQSLRSGECGLALAGGSNLLLDPESMVAISRLRALSPSGRCKTFDASADGFVRSEGCGVVVLKRLRDAVAAGDPILAVIAGSAVNQDGRSNGLTAPSGPAQEEVIRSALAQAGVAPGQVGYVEAHGTGTELGDPIEVQALGAVLKEARPPGHPVLVGAVKSNIGHTEAAAGVTGLIKTVLVLQHGEIPKNLHFRTPSPHIPWDELPVRVPTEHLPFPDSAGARIAGVSSFGLSGTNAHMILTESPHRESASARNGAPPEIADRPLHILPLSARTGAALRARAEQLARHLASHPEQRLADVCYSAATGRAAFAARHALVVDSSEQARVRLAELARGIGTEAGVPAELMVPKVAFLFTGQGSQYAGMGADLYKTAPVFRLALDQCAEILGPVLLRPLLSVLFPEEGSESEIHRTEYTQPCLFALEYSLAQLWLSWGLRPAAVLGHSVGEYVAACVAGVLSLTDGLRLVAERGRLMQGLSTEGGMVAVQASAERIEPLLAPFAKEVSIAAFNGPEHIVLSGQREALRALIGELDAQGIKTTELRVSHAFHSPLMEPMLGELERAAAAVKLHPAALPLISNLSGNTAGAEITEPRYFSRHAREPVRFAQGLKTLKSLGIDAFIEIGPQPTLVGQGSSILGVPGHHWLPSLRKGKDPWPLLLESLARLWMAGADIDWRSFDKLHPRERVLLPCYPWQRQSYWSDAATPSLPSSSSLPIAPSDSPYRLSGGAIEVPGESLHQVVPLGPSRQPYVLDHVVHDRVVVPGSFHLAVLLAVAAGRFGASAVTLRNVQFIQPLLLERDVDLHIVLRPKAAGCYHFSVATPIRGGSERRWLEHLDGELSLSAEPPAAVPVLSELQSRAMRPLPADSLFALYERLQISIGPRWRWVKDIQVSEDGGIARLTPPGVLGDNAPESPLHPAFLDNALGIGMMSLIMQLSADDADPYLPWTLSALSWFHPSNGSGWCYGRLREGSFRDGTAASDVILFDDSGKVVAALDGMVCKRAPRSAFLRQESAAVLDWLYEPVWRPLALAREPQPDPPGHWLVFSPHTARTGESLAERLRQRGASCTRVEPGPRFERIDDELYRLDPADPEGYVRLLQQIRAEAGALRGVVHLFSLDAASDEEITVQELERDQELGSLSALYLAQALIASGESALPRLCLVTAGAQSIDTDVGSVSLSQSPLWGLGRTLALEHPELRCLRVDLGRTESPEEEESLTAELFAGGSESEIVLRNAQRHVRRLIRCPPTAAPNPENPVLRPDGAYLISGGLGGLGLAAAELLVEQGAKHLFLVGRRAPAESAMQRVQRLEAAGARVVTAQIDVSDPQALAGFLSTFGREQPVLRGILHTAGVLADGIVAEQDAERFKQVFAPKVHGALYLHLLTKDQPLDFFICYSSASSLLGSPGQANYAAANAFLDALAHHRRRGRRYGTSVNWGPFSHSGMAQATEGLRERMAAHGVRSMTPYEGQRVLLHLLKSQRTQVGALKLDLHRLIDTYAGSPGESFWSELRQMAGPAPTAAPAAFAKERLLDAPLTEQRSRIDAYLAERVAQVLRSPSEALNRQVSLIRLGMDSLMAVELRNRLDAELGLTVATSLLLGDTSLQVLTAHIMDLLAARSEDANNQDGIEEGEI